MAFRSKFLFMVATCLLLMNAAHADTSTGLFDPPASTQTIPPSGRVNQITCVYYSDIMIRTVGTDTPAPDAATLIPIANGEQRRCATARVPGEIATKTAAFSLFGRKGGYLLFGATDPNGASGIMVLNAATGKTIYSDSMMGDSLKTVDLEAGALHIAFTRGINTTCSLLKDARACWAKLAADGSIPRAISQLPPPVQACSAAYTRDKIQADDPSIITYDVDMTVSLTGKTEVRSRGALGCYPMP